MAKLLCLVALVAAVFGSVAPTATASEGWTECSSSILASPHEPSGAVRICRDGVLAISYDKSMINPALSMYHITPEQARNLLPGRLSFYVDPDLKAMGVTQAAVNSGVFGNDWNRGHLAPNHIMSFSTIGKTACFTMANISPQAGYFNQHPWNTLESKVANWVASGNPLYIITGVAYTSRSNPTRGTDDIAIPNYFWKVLCDTTTGQSVGFWGHNTADSKSVEGYFVTVKEVEGMYGGTLFPAGACKTGAVNKTHWWTV